LVEGVVVLRDPWFGSHYQRKKPSLQAISVWGVGLFSIACLLLATAWPAAAHAAGSGDAAAGGPPALTDLVGPGDYRIGVLDGDVAVAGVRRDAGRSPRMESALNAIAAAHVSRGSAQAQAVATRQCVALDQGRVRVIVVTQLDDAMDLAGAVEELGGRVEMANGSHLQVAAPVSALRPLADLPEVTYVRQPASPQLTATSEGVTPTHAVAWHATGTDGSGVKVAVLSLGFAGYASLQGTELPSSVTTRNFRADGQFDAVAEGTACAEIVHDMAPGADLYLVAFSTDVEFYNAVDYLIGEGVDIVTSSVGWTTTGPYDGTDGNLSWGFQINQKVSEARAAGIFWAQSAGNFRDGHYESAFAGVSVSDGSGGTYTLHDFDGNGTWVNEVGRRYTGQHVSALLSWDDWSEPVDQDYDLWIVGYPGSGTTWYVMAGSESSQNGGSGQLPREAVQYQVPSDYTAWYFGIAIRQYSTSRDGYLELYSYDGYRTPDFRFAVQSSSLCIPADNPDAVTSGATNVSDDSLEVFSSAGPTNGPGGSVTGGITKPDLVAPDGVSTATYGDGSFFGTSAASPHVAGAAALLKEAEPSRTPGQLKSALEDRAVDLGPTGKDNLYGAGRLDLGPGGGATVVTLSSCAAMPAGGGLASWATLACLLLGTAGAIGLAPRMASPGRREGHARPRCDALA
jgi:hypothetical protein